MLKMAFMKYLKRKEKVVKDFSNYVNNIYNQNKSKAYMI